MVTAAFPFIYFLNFTQLNFWISEICWDMKFLVLLMKIIKRELICILGRGILRLEYPNGLDIWLSHPVILKATKISTQTEFPFCYSEKQISGEICKNTTGTGQPKDRCKPHPMTPHSNTPPRTWLSLPTLQHPEEILA